MSLPDSDRTIPCRGCTTDPYHLHRLLHRLLEDVAALRAEVAQLNPRKEDAEESPERKTPRTLANR